jgi:hypothetical protein
MPHSRPPARSEIDHSRRTGPVCWAVGKILARDYAALAVKVYNEAHNKP